MQRLIDWADAHREYWLDCVRIYLGLGLLARGLLLITNTSTGYFVDLLQRSGQPWITGGIMLHYVSANGVAKRSVYSQSKLPISTPHSAKARKPTSRPRLHVRKSGAKRSSASARRSTTPSMPRNERSTKRARLHKERSRPTRTTELRWQPPRPRLPPSG